jgi:hypothetical protein
MAMRALLVAASAVCILVLVALPAASKSNPVKTATLKADEGVVAATGALVKDGSGMKVDIIAYKHGSGLDLKGGRVGTAYQPLHKFGTKTYASLADVPCTVPTAKEKGGYLSLPEAGKAFTVTGNKSPGTWRVRVKSNQGGTAVIEYGLCP